MRRFCSAPSTESTAPLSKRVYRWDRRIRALAHRDLPSLYTGLLTHPQRVPYAVTPIQLECLRGLRLRKAAKLRNLHRSFAEETLSFSVLKEKQRKRQYG